MAQQGPTSAAKLVCFDFDNTLVNAHFHTQLMNEAMKVNSGVYPNTVEPGPQILQPNGSLLRLAGGPEGGFKPMGPVSQQYGAPPEKIQGLIQKFGLKHPQAYAKAMMQAIDNGHKVAITSFTLFPEVAVPTLRAMFATVTPPLSPQQVNHYVKHICVVGGFPSNGAADSTTPGFYGKEEHIQAAMRFFARQGVNISRNNAVLVDDSEANTNIAKAKGPVVEVPPGNASDAYIKQIEKLTAANVNRQPQPLAPVKPSAANKQALPKVPPQMPPRKANAAVVASRPIENNNPTVTKPTGAPPQPPQGVQPYTGQQPRQPSAPLPPHQPTFTHAAPRAYMGKLPSPIPAPLTSEQVAKLIPQNPTLDNILSHDLNQLMLKYQENRAAARKEDNGLTSLFNKAKHAFKSTQGIADERLYQLVSIVNLFGALKKERTMDPTEKANLAFAHLENVKDQTNSTGMRQICMQLQLAIMREYPTVSRNAQFKEQAKALAADTQAPSNKNNNKLT